ncbi:MAG: hypothetical protein HWE08_03110 [Alphaproteobacteria bacterium]|nr:hypothetical protein [Alphaproteobacteria bacterium]
MVRFFSSLVFLVALFSNTSMVQAQQLDELSRRAPYAGVYVSVPLGGTQQQSFTEKAKFGFAAGYQQPLYGRALDLTGRKHVAMKVVNLEFNQRGFDQFAIAGLPFAQKDLTGRVVFLPATEEGGKSGSRVVRTVLLVTGGIIVGSVIIFAVGMQLGGDLD